MPMLDYALAYARQKFQVFPLLPDGKTPLTAHGFHDATTDETQIEAWWTQWSEANVGIATGKASNILVVDVDRHGADGTEALQTLKLPPTCVVKTPRNGYHFIFRYPETGEIGRVIGALPGIDLLGDNGYVVACGSRVNGKPYELIRDRDPAPCPSALVELAAKKRKVNGASAATGSTVGEGRRNDYLASVAGILRRSGFDEDGIYAALEVENQKKCAPPLPQAEVAMIARSVARYEPETTLDPDTVVARSERDEKLKQLASLDELDYAKRRKAEADGMGVTTKALDTAVAETRREMKRGANDIIPADPEPWVSEVSGSELLDEIEFELTSHVILPPHAAAAVALWIVHTWAAEAAYISPLIYPSSPEKRCGKTTLLLFIRKTVRRPLLASNISNAALFRAIEEFEPTFLLDEADTWLKADNDEMRGIINSGHSRETAFVVRTVGDQHEVRAFRTFCPKALAGIGRLADTIEDRSIVIPMKRKRSEDKVRPLREDKVDFATLRAKCRRWASDSLEALKRLDPAMPVGLHDRAADNWRCLLAIADTAGGGWPSRARNAAMVLSAADEDEAIGAALLADIRKVFHPIEDETGLAQPPVPQMSSAILAERLAAMEERPWAEWRHGKPMTATQLARRLQPFRIAPKNIRDGMKVVKGYAREQFSDAWSRYLSATAATPLPVNRTEECSGCSATAKSAVAVESAQNPLRNNVRSDVAAKNGENGFPSHSELIE
jgi:putative DNA primase/helicase